MGRRGARRRAQENKPILLSIGYSACHWCHVMAHESFRGRDVAAPMNKQFINVKVDREERPDLDQIYQTAHQVLTLAPRRLAAHHVPDARTRRPSSAAPIFPRRRAMEKPGILELLPRVAASYREQSRRHRAARQGADRSTFADAAGCRRCRRTDAGHAHDSARASSSALRPDRRRLERGTQVSASGGNGILPALRGRDGDAPLLDRQAHTLDAHGRARPLRSARRRLLPLLRRPAMGDSAFRENALRQRPAAAPVQRMWLVERRPLYARVAADTATWVMREMQSPDGGYYSTLDADSEHVEGKFYVWTPDEVKAVLSADEYAVVASALRSRWPAQLRAPGVAPASRRAAGRNREKAGHAARPRAGIARRGTRAAARAARAPRATRRATKKS